MKKNITVIGTDSTHCTAFARLLNQPKSGDWCIKYAIRDQRSNIDLSVLRREAIEKTMVEELNISLADELTDTILSSTDAFIIASVDASLHLSQFKSLLPYQKPVFIDKPISYRLVEYQEMVALAKQHQVPLMSSSSLRFSEAVVTTKNRFDKIEKLELTGPMPFEKEIPGLFWYGIHLIECLKTFIPSEIHIQTVKKAKGNIKIKLSNQDVDALIQGELTGTAQFSGTVKGYDQKGNPQELAFTLDDDLKPLYAYLLEAMIVFFETRQSPTSSKMTEEIMKLIEEINQKL